MSVITFPITRTKKFAEDLERHHLLWWAFRPFLEFTLPAFALVDEFDEGNVVCAVELETNDADDGFLLGLPSYLQPYHFSPADCLSGVHEHPFFSHPKD